MEEAGGVRKKEMKKEEKEEKGKKRVKVPVLVNGPDPSYRHRARLGSSEKHPL